MAVAGVFALLEMKRDSLSLTLTLTLGG